VRFASEDIEAASREPVYAEQAAEAVAPEAMAEAAVEMAPTPEAAAELPTEVASAEAPAAAPTEVAAPATVLDWGVIYAIVHKVVVEMSPHALPPAAIEDLARRLADEIAPEFGVASPPPQA
jgi:hypothetical protein